MNSKIIMGCLALAGFLMCMNVSADEPSGQMPHGDDHTETAGAESGATVTDSSVASGSSMDLSHNDVQADKNTPAETERVWMMRSGVLCAAPYGRYGEMYSPASAYFLSGAKLVPAFPGFYPDISAVYTRYSCPGNDHFCRTELSLVTLQISARGEHSFMSTPVGVFTDPLILSGEAGCGITSALFRNVSSGARMQAVIPQLGAGISVSSRCDGIFEIGISLRGCLYANQGPKLITVSAGLFAGVML